MARAGQIYLSPLECLKDGPKKSILVSLRKRNWTKWTSRQTIQLRLLHFPPACNMFGETESSILRLGYGLDLPGFESQQGKGIFLCSEKSRPVQEPTQLLFGIYRS